MNVLLITYDLNNEDNRPDVVDKIKEIGSCAKLSESSYAVATSKTPRTVHKILEDIFDEDDNIYVITLKRPRSGRGPKRTNQWLDKHLSS